MSFEDKIAAQWERENDAIIDSQACVQFIHCPICEATYPDDHNWIMPHDYGHSIDPEDAWVCGPVCEDQWLYEKHDEIEEWEDKQEEN